MGQPIPLEELTGGGKQYRESPDAGALPKAGWTDLGGAALDSTEAGLYGVGEALGIPGARRRRLENQVEAQQTQEWANPQLGVAESWDKAQGVGGTARYLAAQGINMAPQMATTLAAGALTGGVGAGIAGYGFALSDTLQNQREQAGTTDLMSAAATAVPYAAVDVLSGGEGKLLRAVGTKGVGAEARAAAAAAKPSRFNLLGRAEHAATEYADDLGRGADASTLSKVGGVGARLGLNAVKTGGEEAAGETFQEVMNQAARMGVDPDATLTSGDSWDRYKESAIVGGLFGGATGAGVGGWRRSAHVGGAQTGESQIGAKADPNVSTTDVPPGVPDSKYAGAATTAPPADPARGVGGDNVMPGATQILNDKLVGPAQTAIEQQQATGGGPSPEEQAQLDMRERRAKDEAVNQRGTAAGVDMNKHGLLYSTLEEAGLDKDVFDRAVDFLASGQADKIKVVKDSIAQMTRERAQVQQQQAQEKASKEAQDALNQKNASTTALLDNIKTKDGKGLSDKARRRLHYMLGLDEDGTPVGDRYTMDEVAQIESGVEDKGKPVTKQAIEGMLAPYGLDEANIDALYEQIHGATTGESGLVAGEGEDVSTGERANKITDTDQSERAGAIGSEEMGDTGAMRNVAGIGTNITVEKNAKERRNEAFKSLLGGDFNADQRAAIEAARKADSPEALQKAKTLFNDDERAAFKIMFEHGDATATAARRPAVQAEIARRKGVLTEHEKQVRERQALANMAQRERDEQARVEAEAQKEGDLAELDGRLDSDGKTLRMHLMDVNKVKQARLISESLADAKHMWSEFMAKYNKPSAPVEEHLPAWDELTPREQASFVRTVDWHNFESQEEEHAAQEKLDRKANELADRATARKAETARQEARVTEASKPEFQAKVREQQAAEAAARAAQLAKDAEERKAAKKEKADAEKSERAGKQAPKPAEAVSAQGDSGGSTGAPREEVVGSGPAAAGDQVPESGARSAADATAGEAHGPGSVRSADGEAAPAPGTEGNRADVEAREIARSFMEDNSSVESDDFADPVKLENGRYMNAPDVAQAIIMSLPANEMTDTNAYGKLGILPEGRADVLDAVNEYLDSNTFQSIERLNHARDQSPAPLTVTAASGVQVEGGVARAPSVTRTVRSSRTALEAGRMTPEAFAAATSAALDAADAVRRGKTLAARLRGADRITEQLLAARRRGELSPEGVELATWFIRQNPLAVANLGLSIRARIAGEEGASGHYNPVARIVTLMKGSLNPETAVHEILHHLERMMPVAMQNAIRREWTKSIAKAYQGALKAGNTQLGHFYKLLTDYHFDNGDPRLLDQALDMLHNGQVGYEHYQNFNPSEFWAVNGSRIVQNRFNVDRTMVGRIRQWMSEFVQRAKAVLGMQSDNAVIRGLNSIANADGNFTSGTMLQDQPGVHFMYAGEKTADQEKTDQLQKYEWMRAGGSTAEEARLATGWFRNPADGKMRYEFSDHDAEFTSLRPPERMEVAGAYEEPTSYRLDEVLDHPALYEAYPEARDIRVTRQLSENDPGNRVQGWYNPDTNLVNITPHAVNPLSTLVHELQHWVQDKEGHAVGGSPEQVVHAMTNEQRARLLDRVLAEQAQPDYVHAHSVEDREYLQAMAEEGDPDALAQLAAGTEALLRAYKHIAGEIEARDTQARMDMTPKTRMDTKPLTSEFISRKDIVTIMKSDPASVQKSVEKDHEQRLMNVERVKNAAMARVPDGKAKDAVKTLGNMVGNSAKTLIKGLTFTRDLIAMAQKGLPSAGQYLQFEEQRNAAKIEHQHRADVIVAAHKKLSVADRAGVNNFLKRSTIEGKWGYVPDHFSAEDQAKMKDKLDPGMVAAYNALKPEQKKIVEDVFRHGYETLQHMKTLVNLNVADEFNAAIELAKKAGNDKLVAQLEEDKTDQLAHFKTLLAVGEYNPYAPLKRFGNHVVVGKSQAYLDMAQRLDDNPNDKEAAKALREMQSQPAHYFVAMRESKHAAQALRDQIAAGPDRYAQTYTTEKNKGYLSEIGGNRGMLGMFHRLKGQAEREGDSLSGSTKAATDRMMTDLYLSLLSETSARQAERERRNVAGAEDDMMRAFHSKANADANFLASLATAGPMQDTLSAMEREADKNEASGVPYEQRQEHYQEILKRHVQSMDYKQSPFVDFAMETSSIMQLLTSPAYHLTNLLQPYVMSAPNLAGRHGMAASLGALMTAHKELGVQLFKNGVDHSNISDLPADVQRGVRVLMDKGFIQMTLDSEHGANWSEGPIGKILAPMKRFSQRVEAVNRVATGVAALRLAAKAGLSENAAIDYAAKIINDTHGDYSGFNTPSMMRGPVARLITQYRKFQLIQISNYTKMIRDSFFNADLSKEEKWVARKMLAYNLGTMFTLGGTLALPGSQFIGAMLRVVFGDDDEPNDPELTMRKYLSDAGLEGISTLLVKGVPAWMGVDVSGRMGAGNILSLFPNADTSEGMFLSRKAWESYALAATGPFIGGLMPKLADGAGKFASGDIYKGIEGMAPNGLANILKGARIATQGVTDSKGNTVMDADSVSALAGLGQALGFPTTTITERTARASAMREMDLKFKKSTSDIKNAYVRAYRDGDTDKMAQARDDWADLQARMKAHEFTPPKTGDLIKAPHAQDKKDKALIGGVTTTKRTAGAARQLQEIYD